MGQRQCAGTCHDGPVRVRVDGDYDYVDHATRQRRVVALEQDDVHSESVVSMKHALRRRRGNVFKSCACSPYRDADPFAHGVVARAMELAEVTAMEKDVLDAAWAGPWGLPPPLEMLLGPEDEEHGNTIEKITLLANGVENLVAAESTLLHAPVPTRIFGDLHGQFRDLLLWLQDFGFPHDYSPAYVFNGDWVDRGKHQVETVVLLFALKITFPQKMFLVRGNHEFEDQNIFGGARGFKAACDALGPDGDHVFDAFHCAFDQLSLACVVGHKILVLHGGIGDGDWDLDQLAAVEKPITDEHATEDLLIHNILWSDPLPESVEQSFGVHSSPRDGHSQKTKTFGKDVTLAFCERNDIEIIVRSHQERAGGCGYEIMHGSRLMRVFSARDYEGNHNDGAMLKVRKSRGGKLVIRAQLLRSLTKVRGRVEEDCRLAAPPFLEVFSWSFKCAPANRGAMCAPEHIEADIHSDSDTSVASSI